MIRKLTIAAALLAAPMAHADGHITGDAEAGEAAFRACIACHVVTDPEGNVLAGRNGRQGPNLYGVAGRAAGTVEGFRYSSGMVTAAEAGLVWDEASFVGYLPNPTAFLREFTGESVRSNMTNQRVDETTAADLFAFLAQFGEAEMDAMDEEMEEEASE